MTCQADGCCRKAMPDSTLCVEDARDLIFAAFAASREGTDSVDAPRHVETVPSQAVSEAPSTAPAA